MAGRLQEKVGKGYRKFRGGLNDRQAALLESGIFLSRFLVLAAPLYLLIVTGRESYWLRSVTASVSAAVIDSTGLNAVSTGAMISSGDILLDVTWDSTGWKSFLALTALILATRKPSREKVKGVAAGLLVVFSVNVLRISSMVYAVRVFNVGYELLHMLLWRWGLTLAVLLTWITWLHGVPRFHRRFLRR